jgi:signal transduction histidine kinase
VRGDPDRLRQVFWNLLTNAVKFTTDGGTVEISAERTEGSVQVSVIDSGAGIAGESLPYVFGRFWQGDAARTHGHSGLGLGLALVRDFVEMHGGRVEAHSAGPGRGSRFDVMLPALAASEDSVRSPDKPPTG